MSSADANRRDRSTLPLVSVITPTYNWAELLPETIESALAQDYPNLEIIVADDGSTDDTQAVLDRYAGRIVALRLPHRGENPTRNAAIAASRGDYVAFLDHDDLWLPTKVSEQVEAMESRSEVGLSHTAWEKFGGGLANEPHIHRQADKYHGRCFNTIFRQNGVGALTAMIRRTALPPHVFHEDIQITADYALWLDVLFYHEAHYIPKILARHRVHSDQITHGRRERWKIYEALSRFRLLNRVRGDLSDERYEELRSWTIERLWLDASDRLQEKDYGWAVLGFDLLDQQGFPVPLGARMRAKAGSWRHRFTGQDKTERRYLDRPAW